MDAVLYQALPLLQFFVHNVCVGKDLVYYVQYTTLCAVHCFQALEMEVGGTKDGTSDSHQKKSRTEANQTYFGVKYDIPVAP